MRIGFNPLRDMLLTIIAISLLIYFLVRWNTNHSNQIHPSYLLFDSSNIKGKVDTISIRFNLEALKVDNSDQEYLFAPNITEEGAFFHAYTEKGDSIIKPPYSKVVIVKGKDTSYTYTFKKY
jgi:hypothetical protein